MKTYAFIQLDELVSRLQSIAVSIVGKLIFALLIFIVGRSIIKLIKRSFKKWHAKKNLGESAYGFMTSCINIVLNLILVLTIASVLGVPMTSIITLIGSAGLAVGLALQGGLSNFAGGVMILLFRPFRVGDFIEAQGKSGTVKEIQLIHTVLNTVDNQTILLPNGPVSTGIINNYSREPQRQVEWTFGIAYGDDYQTAKETIAELLKKDPRVLDEKGLTIHLNSLGDSSVNILVRAWVNAPDFWGLFWDMNEQVYRVFAEKGLNIPFPQMDVHLYKGDE